jgi:hypothetical protein
MTQQRRDRRHAGQVITKRKGDSVAPLMMHGTFLDRYDGL